MQRNVAPGLVSNLQEDIPFLIKEVILWCWIRWCEGTVYKVRISQAFVRPAFTFAYSFRC
jgi:hypothetical protein